MKILACNGNRPLALGICNELGVEPVAANIRRFADSEVYAEIHENVRGSDVFIVQPTACPANDNLIELLICIDALRRGSARRITAVLPYYGYARQDRKTGPRTPISAKLIANLITVAGANRILTMDLHAGQIQGFFDIPADNLYAAPLFARDISERFDPAEVVIVSPDIGGVGRARGLGKRIGAPLAIIDKRREKPGVSEVMHVIGDVDGKHAILIDDMVDSGGTLCNAAEALLEHGAKSVCAYATHGVLSNNAHERITASKLDFLTVTDSIENKSDSNSLRFVSVVPLLGEAIRRISEERSVSSLFD